MRKTDVIRAEERNADMYSSSVIYSGTVLIMLIISYGDISVINIAKLYMIRLAKISCITQSFFLE